MRKWGMKRNMMMNSSQNNEEQQVLIKQLVSSFMKDYSEQLNSKEKGNNNSFVFLENNTLQMLITYMFMHLDNNIGQVNRNEDESPDLEEISLSIDSMVNETRVAYEEIIDMLKE